MSGEIKRSKICVPIVAVDEIEIIRQLKKITDKKKTAMIDMVEFRADYYKDLNDFKKLDKLLMNIRDELNKEGIKLLFTIRSKAEGGEALDFEKPAVNEINLHIAENKLADLIDIEYYSEKNSADRVMSEAKKNNIKIILSSHDFEKTPSLDEMLERYKGMQERKADIIKLAVMPHSEQDVSNLLKAVLSTYEKYSDVKVVGISMGELGRRTRIEGYKYGSYMTFAIIDKASAPGQVSVEELN